MLRDRLICGVNDPRIQRRLLSEADLDFDKALKTAQAMEMADRDAEELKGGPGERAVPETEGEVHKAASVETRTRSYQNCHRCGGNHKASSCRHKETICHHCGIKGHIRRVCHKRSRGGSQRPQNTMPVTALPEEEEQKEFTMFPLRNKTYQPIYITLVVNNSPLRMEVDTGATLLVISEATYHQT